MTEESQGLQTLSKDLANWRREKDRLEAELKTVEENIKKYNDDLLKVMQTEEIEKFTTPDGTFYINRATRARVVNPDVAFGFLRNVGLGDLIKEAVNAQSLSSAIKEQVSDGKFLLTDLENQGISVYVDESVRVRK